MGAASKLVPALTTSDTCATGERKRAAERPVDSAWGGGRGGAGRSETVWCSAAAENNVQTASKCEAA
jgi:hypothetical protein